MTANTSQPTRRERFACTMWFLTHPRWRRNWQMNVANRMPKWLVYWCTIRLWSKATTGKYGNEVPMDVPVDEALRRWGERAA